MKLNMSWTDRVARELEMRMPFLPTKVQLVLRRVLGREMSPGELRCMQEIGAKVGLTKRETLQVVANYPTPVGLLDSSVPNARNRILMVLLVLIVIVFAFMVMTGTVPGGGPTTTYVPGSLYATVNPRDFR